MGKISVFDSAFHIPLIIRGPDCPDQAGTRMDAMTESVDIAPTVLDWISGRGAAGMNGRSLLGFLRGREPRSWRAHSFSELDFGDPESPTHLQTALRLGLRDAALCVLRETDRTLVHFGGGLPPLMFDTSAKDGEMRCLAGDAAWQSELLRLTRSLLDHRMRHADHSLSDMKVTAQGTVNQSVYANSRQR